MAVYDLYSKRSYVQDSSPDSYHYEPLPDELGVQFFYIVDDCAVQNYYFYKVIVEILRREYGLEKLPADMTGQPATRDFNMPAQGHSSQPSAQAPPAQLPPSLGQQDTWDYKRELRSYYRQLSKPELQLDVIELVFRYISNSIDDAQPFIQELNQRFHQHGLGYAFEEGKIRRLDQQFMYAELIKPALQLCEQPGYHEVTQQLLLAHQRLRSGKSERVPELCMEALTLCLQQICKKHNWLSPAEPKASKLFTICSRNGLFPKAWKQELSALEAQLERAEALSTIQRKNSPAKTPPYLLEFFIHSAASLILLFCRAESHYQQQKKARAQPQPVFTRS